LTHPTGHFLIKKNRKNWDLAYRHIYLGHPLNLKGVWANIILGGFISATPSSSTSPIFFVPAGTDLAVKLLKHPHLHIVDGFNWVDRRLVVGWTWSWRHLTRNLTA
jgi:hypothetical protein